MYDILHVESENCNVYGMLPLTKLSASSPASLGTNTEFNFPIIFYCILTFLTKLKYTYNNSERSFYIKFTYTKSNPCRSSALIG